MDAVIESIKMQTNVTDDVVIEQTFKDCQGDVLKTIMKLMDISEPPKKAPTFFDNLREICDEKDTIYQELGKAVNQRLEKTQK